MVQIHAVSNPEKVTYKATKSRKVAPNYLSDDIKKSLESSRTQYLRTTQNLLDSEPSAAALYKHMDFLRKSRDSFHTQCKRIKSNTEKHQIILDVIASIDEAITNVSKYIVAQLNEMNIHGGAAYAYGPREGVHYDIHTPGRDHFQLALPLVHGRLVRQMGDLMCRPSREFWGLRITDDPQRITCWACLKWMLRILESRPEEKQKTRQ
jgi:hypothetical protein